MIPGKRPGTSRSVQHATLVALLLVAAVLAGCSGLASTNGETAASAPDPSYREVIANRLRSTFKDYASYDLFEISDPRWVHSVQGWSWLTCVRFQDHGHRRTYALFLKANAITDARYAVQTDDCDTPAYSPFERMGGAGLQPLH